MSRENVEKFYDLVRSDEKLAQEIIKINEENQNGRDFKNGTTADEKIIKLAKENNLNFTLKELLEYSKDQLAELSDEELSNVSGGGFISWAIITLLSFWAAANAAPTNPDDVTMPAQLPELVFNDNQTKNGVTDNLKEEEQLNNDVNDDFDKEKSSNNVSVDFNDGTLTIYGKGKLTKGIIVDALAGENQDSIKTVIFASDSNITAIDNKVFNGCSSLTNITIPDSITSIGHGAFKNCSALKNIKLSKNIKSIYEKTFYGCSSLTSINIPDSVTSIGNDAFGNCSALESITIPDSVTSIGFGAFYVCSSLEHIGIPNSVTSIGDLAFEGCSALTNITIPDNVTSIDDFAFEGCSSLTSINIPAGVTEIDRGTFENCSALTNITIPDSVTSIGWVFWDCTGLETVTFDESSRLKKVGEHYAFYNCKNLKTVNNFPGTKLGIENNKETIKDTYFFYANDDLNISIQ